MELSHFRNMKEIPRPLFIRGFIATYNDAILSQLNAVHTQTPYFVKIDFNIMLPSTHRSSK